MQISLGTLLLTLGFSFVVMVGGARAQTPVRWLAHDMKRPRPPVVTPGKQNLPVAPPSDAKVIFDGKDLAAWRDAEGGPAKWRVNDGYMESVANSGYVYSAEG